MQLKTRTPGVWNSRKRTVGSKSRIPSLPDAWMMEYWEGSHGLILGTCFASIASALFAAVDARPRGSVDPSIVEIKPSQLHGKGLFARRDIVCGTVLGKYPGRLRNAREMIDKCEKAPQAKDYVYQTELGYFLDPTDMQGKLSPRPGPGLPWPFNTPVEVALTNEPPPGVGGANARFEETGFEVLLVTSREIQAGEELYVDYGHRYDRSGYT